MKCSHIQSVLSEYLDGQLSHVQATQVEQHLTVCDSCQGQWRLLRKTVRLVAHLGHEKCPVDLRATVAMATQGRAPAPRWHLGLPLAAAAGVATGVTGLILMAGLLHPALGGRTLRAHLASGEPALVAEAVEPPLHDQYDLAAGMGSVDGLLLALPTERGHIKRPRISAQLRPRTNQSN
jgi:anti-sigma factor RsiW